MFADHFTQAVARWGRVGIIVPTGLVTDYTYRDFFAHLVGERRLAATYDFVNKRGLFPEVAPVVRFVTLVATASGVAEEARFAFMVEDPTELDAAERTYTLSPDQIALVNPNTKTAPVFLSRRDAEITTKVYQRHPVLIRHSGRRGNPWGIRFLRMFDMSNDSGLFHTAEQLRADGWTLIGNTFERDNRRMLPLYEAKLFGLFDADYQSYEDVPEGRKFNVKAGVYKTDRSAGKVMQPRYWVAERAVQDRLPIEAPPAFLAWRNITNTYTSPRTAICAIVPIFGHNNSAPLCLPSTPPGIVLIQASWGSFAFDYIARQKLAGVNFTYSIMEQLPVPSPTLFAQPAAWDGTQDFASWVAERSGALSATTDVLAQALGYASPVEWNDLTRLLWRTELDASMFHLYGYSRDEVAYVMDTFPIVARKDRQAEGLADDDPNWRTKRLILAKFDELAEHARVGTTYMSPDPPPPLPEKLRLSAVSEVGGA